VKLRPTDRRGVNASELVEYGGLAALLLAALAVAVAVGLRFV
jgi:hypothetical protein